MNVWNVVHMYIPTREGEDGVGKALLSSTLITNKPPPPLPFLAQGIDLDSHDSILHIYILLYLPPLLAIS